MPELPEVETVVRGLCPHLEGRVLARVAVRRPNLRQPFPPGFATALAGARIIRIVRRAKYILAHTDRDTVWLTHLGMSGRLTLYPATGEPAPPAGRHDHVVLETTDGTTLRFHDPRRFGLMDLVAERDLALDPRLAPLGPEPLAPDFTPAVLAARLAGRRGPIKTVLLDQRVIAGLGNIYVSESLFRAGISPQTAAGSLPETALTRLVTAIRQVLQAAIAAGGSSLRDYVQADGHLGYFQHQFAVYGRAGQPCPGCTCDVSRSGGIQRLVQGGRSTFYCPHQQQ